MVKLTNTGSGARGVWTNDGTVRFIDPGQSWEGDLADFPQELHSDLKEGEPTLEEQLAMTPEDEEIMKALSGLSPEAQSRFTSMVSLNDAYASIMGQESPAITTPPTAITPQAPSESDATGVVNDPKDMVVPNSTETTSGAPQGANAKVETPDDKSAEAAKKAGTK